MKRINKTTLQYLKRRWPLKERPNSPEHLWLGLRYGAKKASKAKWTWKDGQA